MFSNNRPLIRLLIRTVFPPAMLALLTLCLLPLASAAAQSKTVESAQQALHDKGYDPGPIDGRMGPQTRQAIGEYQKSQNYPVTQTLDARTSESLGVPASSGSAKQGAADDKFKTAGHDFAAGGKGFGKEIAKGKPIEAGKDLGKGVGAGGENTGKGVADTGKGVADDVDKH